MAVPSSVCVLLVATGAPWESAALGLLSARPGVVVLRRCVDVDDLLASASTGQAEVAVVALEAHGLDPHAVERLTRDGVRLVAVTADPSDPAARVRAGRLGVTALVGETDVAALGDAVVDPAGGRLGDPSPDAPIDLSDPADPADPDDTDAGRADAAPTPGRVVAVWGAAGAPGRTTVALGLAAELAHRGAATLLVDADPYAGSVAQHLGVLDEVSGLLAAARLAAAGDLAARFASTQRSVADRLRVVTGLPRPDRWREVRPGCLEHVVELGRAGGHVVLDTGFSLEDEPTPDLLTLPGRNALTLAAVGAADEVVVVGAADPVGLARLARALVEVRDVVDDAPVRVVVNRMRPGLGWSEAELTGMVAGFARVSGLHFLPDDRGSVDRAQVAGRTLVETGDGPLRRALADLADAVAPETERSGSRRGRRRGRARPARADARTAAAAQVEKSR